MQWHLLFCLSQFIVHLFTFLLVLWLCCVGGLSALFLGGPARCNLLIFGLFQGFMACCGLFWFGRLYARLFHLHRGWHAKQHRDVEREGERHKDRWKTKFRWETSRTWLIYSAMPCHKGAGRMLSCKWPAPFMVLMSPSHSVPEASRAIPIASESGHSRVKSGVNITSHFINFSVCLWLQEGLCKPRRDCFSGFKGKKRCSEQREVQSLAFLAWFLHLSAGHLVASEQTLHRCLASPLFYSPKSKVNSFKIKEEQKPSAPPCYSSETSQI